MKQSIIYGIFILVILVLAGKLHVTMLERSSLSNVISSYVECEKDSTILEFVDDTFFITREEIEEWK